LFLQLDHKVLITRNKTSYCSRNRMGQL